MIICGDAKQVLSSIEGGSVDMIITSPPYYRLRDYGIAGQIGLEDTPDEYINNLCDIFDEGKRALLPRGTCWVNLGDSYNKKSLVGIPAQFQIEMMNRGWILRNVIVWHKPACMPSSVKDRFTIDFEYLFFFVRGENYYFEQQLEPLKCPDAKSKNATNKHSGYGNPTYSGFEYDATKYTGRNKRCVWTVNTARCKEAHFAVFPEALIETPIKAGCPIGGVVCDPFCGSGTTGIVAKRLGRKFIGIELNEEYCKMSRRRIDDSK